MRTYQIAGYRFSNSNCLLPRTILWYTRVNRIGRVSMKSFLLACVAAIAIAIISGLVLNVLQNSVDQAFTTESVRLG